MSKGLLILMALLVTGSFFLAGISAVFKQFDNHDAKSMRDWIITYMHAAVLFACVYFVFSSAVYGFESFRGVESLAWMKGEHSIGSYVEAFVSFFYFSVVSITTLGYGDIHPALSWAKLLVSLEALLGLYIIAVGIGRALAVRSSEFKDQPQQVHDAWKHSSGVR